MNILDYAVKSKGYKEDSNGADQPPPPFLQIFKEQDRLLDNLEIETRIGDEVSIIVDR